MKKFICILLLVLVALCAYWYLWLPTLPAHKVAQFPSTVLCNGRNLKMVYRPMPDAYGMYYPLQGVIFIAPDYPLPFEREVVLHEIMHCAHRPVYAVLKKIQGVDHPVLDSDQWIEATAPELLQVMRDNPGLVKYLLQGDVN